MQEPVSIRILLADDQPLFRKAIATLIGDQPDLTIVGEAENGLQAVELARVLQPDVVVLDVDEMLPDDFREIARANFDPAHQFAGQWHNFWRSPHHIRVGTDADPHWGPTLRPFIFPAHTITAGPAKNHTAWICPLPLVEIAGLTIFHYHYLFLDVKPAFDNRYHEMRGFESRDFLLRSVSLRHPEALRHVQELAHFGEFADLLQNEGGGR